MFAVLGWRRFKRLVVITSFVLILVWLGSWVYFLESDSGGGAIMASGLFLLFVTMLTALPALIGLAALGLRRLVDKI
jgi:hypothetical protein